MESLKLKNIVKEVFEGSGEIYDYKLVGEKKYGEGLIEAKYTFETPDYFDLPQNVVDSLSDKQKRLSKRSGSEYEVKIKPFRHFEGYDFINPKENEEPPPTRFDFGHKGFTDKTHEDRALKVINTVKEIIEEFVGRHDGIKQIAIFAQKGIFEKGDDSTLDSKRGRIYKYILEKSSKAENVEKRHNDIDNRDYLLADIK